MRVLVAPQALKGSLSGPDAARAIALGLQRAGALDLDLLPVADGGEGTVEALVSAAGGELRRSPARDPLGRPIVATWGLIEGGRTAVVELAAASGLGLLDASEREPGVTGTEGTGDLIRAALDAGAEKIILGFGGSATNDGGAGILRALGAGLRDDDGREIPSGGLALARLRTLDLSGIDPRLRRTGLLLAVDVDNPLLGPDGASAVYGPQKGASPDLVGRMDSALAVWASALENATGASIAAAPGAGAAGGAVSALLWLPNVSLRPGIELVLAAAHFDERCAGANLVVTAEGRVDATSARGKSTAGVARAAARFAVPAIVFAGSIGEHAGRLVPDPFAAIVPIVDRPMSQDHAMLRAPELLASAAERTIRLYRPAGRRDWQSE